VTRTTHPRLMIPTIALIGGSAIALGTWIGAGWAAALGIETVSIVGAAAYYVLGGRDSDVGALIGSRPDERQLNISTRSTALAGIVLILVALGGVVVSSAVGGPGWVFLLFCVVGGFTYLAGLAIFRDG
jgi:hypothetical protein